MWRRIAVIAVVLAVFAGFFAQAKADLTPGQKKAAEFLIEQFSSRRFAARQQAVEKLVALGADVVPLIRKALAETADNEVKLRCRMVLKALKADTHAAEPAGDFGLDASKITLDMHEAELDEILQELAKQSGNAPLPMPENWEGRLLTFAVKNMPYWEALDALCAKAKLTYTIDHMSGGLKLVPRETGTVDISAHTGPVVVKVEAGTLTRSFRGRGSQLRTRRHGGLTYTLNYFWEDRLPVIEKTASATRVTDPDGRQLKLASDVQVPRVFFGHRRAATPASRLQVVIPELPKGLKKIGEIEGIVKLTTGAGRRTIKINGVFADGEKTASQGDVTLTVSSVNRRGPQGMFNLSLTAGGKETHFPDYPSNSQYGVCLVDPNGRQHHGMISRRGHMVFRTAHAGGGGMVENLVVRLDRRNGRANTGKASVTFRNLPRVEGAWTLVYTMPEKTVTREYPFKIKETPLPLP